jgi:anti-anti-sigma factor
VAVASGRVRETLNRLAETLADKPGPVVLDFGAVEFVGSEDLGALVVLHKRAKVAGGRLALVNVRPTVSDVFTLTRLDTLFDVLKA